MKVLAFDLGKHLGFAVFEGQVVRSGSREILKNWSPFGPALLVLEGRLAEIIGQFKPTDIGVARPFVRRGDTPLNLLPMYGAFAVLARLAATLGLPVHVIQESDARRALVGSGNLPRASAAAKAAVVWACKARGWRCCDDHAGDALCIGAAVVERLKPSQAHKTTPLFQRRRHAR